MSHYIEKCKRCGIVIGECRCPSKDKTVTYGICKRCFNQIMEEDDNREMLNHA